jgi:hypothetical protein
MWAQNYTLLVFLLFVEEESYSSQLKVNVLKPFCCFGRSLSAVN